MNDHEKRQAIQAELAGIIEKAHAAHAGMAQGDARFVLTALEDVQTRAGHAAALLVEAERGTTIEALNKRAKVLEGLQRDHPGLTPAQGNWLIAEMPEPYRTHPLKARAWARGVRAGMRSEGTHEPPFESPLQEAHRRGHDYGSGERSELEAMLTT